MRAKFELRQTAHGVLGFAIAGQLAGITLFFRACAEIPRLAPIRAPDMLPLCSRHPCPGIIVFKSGSGRHETRTETA